MSERDWPEPHLLFDDDFSDLCKEHTVEKKSRDTLRAFLDDLVNHLKVMRRDLLESRFDTDVRDAFQAQQDALLGVTQAIRSLAWTPGTPRGWRLLPQPGATELSIAAAARLPVLASPIYWTHEILRESPTALMNTSTPMSRAYLTNFVRAQPTDVLDLIIRDLAEVFGAASIALQKKVTRGRKRYVLAPILLSNLAQAYHSLGRRPAKNPDGPFGIFAADVTRGIGELSNLAPDQAGGGSASAEIISRRSDQRDRPTPTSSPEPQSRTRPSTRLPFR